MSLLSTIPRSVALGTNSTGIYPWDWLADNDPVTGEPELHVAVLSNATPQVLTVLTLGMDYTIQYPDLQIGQASGGNIILSASGFLAPTGNLPTGWGIIIRRVVTFAQTAQLGNQEGYDPASVESALDYIVMQTLQLQDAVAHCVQTPIDDYATPTQKVALSAARANQFLAFDSNGNPISSPGTITGIAVSTLGGEIITAANAAAVQALIAGAFGAQMAATTTKAAAQTLIGGAFGATLLAESTNLNAQVSIFGTTGALPQIGEPSAVVGSSTAYSFPALDSTDGQIFFMQCGNTNVGTCTFATQNHTYPIISKAGAPLTNGALVSGSMYILVLLSGSWWVVA